MPCFYPLAATQLPSGAINIHRRTPGIPIKPTPAHLGRDLKLPCGRCLGCRMQTTQNWAVRCLHESQLHEENCFLTLTIDPNYQLHQDPVYPHQDVWIAGKSASELSTIAPEALQGAKIARVGNSLAREEIRVELEGSLNKKTHQKFMKRYREKIGVPVRFYMCGEYGEKLGRPHYHYLIFGHNFADRKYSHTSKSGERLYTSDTLEQLWPFGRAWIGDVTYESCAYVAAYVMKKISGSMADWHYRRTDEYGNDYWLEPEFALMSRGGRQGRGLAAEWLDEFRTDVYTEDHVIRNAVKCKPPRYYDKLLALMDPARWEEIKFLREQRAKELADDNTPARLADKEICLKAKLGLKKRNLEQQ